MDRKIEMRNPVEVPQKSKEIYHSLMVHAAEALFLADTEGNLIEVNKKAEELLGYCQEELLNMTLCDIDPNLPEEEWPAHWSRLKKQRIMKYESHHKTKDGRIFPVEINAQYFQFNGNEHVFAFVFDISQRKQAEERNRMVREKLQSLTIKLSVGHEKERRRIATKLHDFLGQTIALCKLKVEQLQKSVSSGGFSSSLKGIRECIDQSVHYTRTLTAELSPLVLYEIGLEPALRWLADQIEEKHGIECTFHDETRKNVASIKTMDESTRILLFQAVRETLMNVVKHAQSRTAKISLDRGMNDVKITIEDDGVGFDLTKINFYDGKNEYFGIFSTREWLASLGGTAHIESNPGQGTVVTLTVPIRLNSKTIRGN